ncbi:hypothetical protein [Streptomyces sp. NPDC001530]|uniref:hypothetical protein n=1 Tax=Streptomyces sp. NPDC001530 TaxID=3364582 RepID=UPI00369D4249
MSGRVTCLREPIPPFRAAPVTQALDGLPRRYDDGRAALELWRAAIAAGGS